MSVDWDRLTQDNEERKYAYDFDKVIREYLFKEFSHHIGAGLALELGAYHGDCTEVILKYCSELTVLEASGECIEVVRARFGDKVRLIQSVIENYEPEQRYQSIFLVHTLEHLPNPEPTLRTIGQWLAPGGKLFIAVPNAHAISRQLAVEMGMVECCDAVTPGEREHGHHRTYTWDTLCRAVQSADLKVATRGGVLLKPFANFQFDAGCHSGLITPSYIEACHQLGKKYPDLCASLYVVCDSA